MTHSTHSSLTAAPPSGPHTFAASCMPQLHMQHRIRLYLNSHTQTPVLMINPDVASPLQALILN